MKLVLILIGLTLFSCQEKKNTGNENGKKPIVIQIQPFSDVDKDLTVEIAEGIKNVYPRVEILAPIDLPKTSFYQPRNRYRADSIIRYLSQNTPNGFVKIGLTNKDISVTKGTIPDFGVMGLGYRPGKSCVASTFRLNKNNRNLQFYKVAIHELGHTQGLKHCQEKTCFMRDAEGGNRTDELTAFCTKCKTFLELKDWKFK